MATKKPPELPAAVKKEIEGANPTSAYNLAQALIPATRVRIQAPALQKHVAGAQATLARVIEALEAHAATASTRKNG